ncbi:hypothetical protein [Trichococcus sp.]|uniref:hypothetical protein n=1 Tax=Trichococcus sp. TaxID=1985464 RepID=UPI003C7BD428
MQKHVGLGSEVFRSYIIFSERYELKKMFVRSLEMKVMNRNVPTRGIEHDLNSLTEVISDL